MTETKAYTSEEVEKHNKPEDCWMVIGPPGQKKVYDITHFLDDHPGGPEVLLDLAGKDADDEFEDIGHSLDARKQLKGLEVGTLKEDPNAVKSKKTDNNKKAASGGSGGVSVVSLLLIPAILAIAAWFYLNKN